VVDFLVEVEAARFRRGHFDDQGRAHPFLRHVEGAPVAHGGDAEDDHQVGTVGAQVGDVPGDAHIAEDDGVGTVGDAGEEDVGEVADAPLVVVIAEHLVALLGVQQVDEAQGDVSSSSK
jgi:hypothetical protein